MIKVLVWVQKKVSFDFSRAIKTTFLGEIVKKALNI